MKISNGLSGQFADFSREPRSEVKALFITHDIGNYGASRSLQLLLKNYRNVEIDLVIPYRSNFSPPDVEVVRKKFGPAIGNIYCFHLPFAFNYRYRPDFTWKSLAGRIVRWILWQINKTQLYRLIKAKGYDFVHLNSLVLYPVIVPHFPFILHVRDICDGSGSSVYRRVQLAKGIIFIDEATLFPFRECQLPRNVVLNNPFDMTVLKDLNLDKYTWPEEGFRHRTIFSIVGTVTRQKGVEFIVRCFLKVRNPDARLLIVGRGPEPFLNYCRQIAISDPRIIFWGEEENIEKIFAVSDYIVRGEEYQCIGRTIFEGLYSGCHVIVPALAADLPKIFEYEEFQSSIHSYEPRNDLQLISILESKSHQKARKEKYRSNVAEYIEQFDGFVRSVIDSKTQLMKHGGCC